MRLHSDDPYHPVSIPYGNWNIGFLSITLFLNQSEGRELVHTLNIYSEDRVDAFLRFLEEVSRGYDLFILSVHGGIEYKQVPSARKAEFFTMAAEAGADIIWGHHPHVLQPWDYFDHDDRRKLIIYSAGNLISGQTWYLDPLSPDPRLSPTGESALFRVQVIRRGGEAHIIDVATEFIFNYRDGPMVIRKAEGLLEDPHISDAWRTYYTERYKHLQNFAVPAAGAYLNGRDESR